MPTFAPNTTRTVKNSFGRSRQGAAVTGIWVHHQANRGGGDAVDYMSKPNSRDSHPTYATDKRGRAIGIVHPDLSPSSTFYVNDQGAVAIEIANVAGEPRWEVPEAALEALAQIIAHHARQSPRPNRAVRNRPGTVQDGFWVGTHDQVYATACPGPHVLDELDRVIARANAILDGKGVEGASAPKPKPAPKPAPKPKAGKAPAFPLPASWYFGPESGPPQSVSGRHGNKHGSAEQMNKQLWYFQKQLQRRGWDFSRWGTDGIYGDETRENVTAFQREKGLRVDGLIGPATWRAAWEEPVT